MNGFEGGVTGAPNAVPPLPNADPPLPNALVPSVPPAPNADCLGAPNAELPNVVVGAVGWKGFKEEGEEEEPPNVGVDGPNAPKPPGRVGWEVEGLGWDPDWLTAKL